MPQQQQPDDRDQARQPERSHDDDQHLEDLEPDEAAATDVRGGGFRVGRGRGGGRNT